MPESGSVFTLAWQRLQAGSAPDGDLTIPSMIIPGVATPAGPLRAAIGTSGEVTLLVPLDFRDRFPEVRESPSLAIRDSTLTIGQDRVRFIEIVCRTPELDEVFAQVADKVVQRISDGVSAGRSVERTLEEFRQLFLRGRPSEITRESAAGLVAELIMLRQTLSISPSSWRYWTGPEGARHDFTRGDLAMEVKATLRSQLTTVEIAALDQLVEPAGGQLKLALVVLEPAPDGPLHVPGLAEQVLRVADDADGLNSKLMAAGFVRESPEEWDAFRFSEIRRSMYRIEAGFPRIVPGSFEPDGLPPGVSHVRYRIDLGQAENFRMTDTDAESFLGYLVT